jgi:hypothetical protein
MQINLFKPYTNQAFRRVRVRLLSLMPMFLATLSLQAQTRAKLLEPVPVPIIQNGQHVGTGQARAGTIVQILKQNGDTVEIQTPLGRSHINTYKIQLLEENLASIPDSLPQPIAASNLNHSQTIASQKPQRSRIEIKEKKEIVPKKYSNRCREHALRTEFIPSLQRGLDIMDKQVYFRFYIITNEWQLDEYKYPRGRWDRNVLVQKDRTQKRLPWEIQDGNIRAIPRLQFSEIVKPDQLIQGVGNFTKILDSCVCQKIADMPVENEFIGWYAELVSDEKVIMAEQSSDDPRILESVRKNPEIKMEKMEIQVSGVPTLIIRLGSGPIGVVFFPSRSSPLIDIIPHGAELYRGLLPEKCSFFVLQHPKLPIYEELSSAMKLYERGDKDKFRPNLSGIANQVVDEIHSKTGIQEWLLVGNSFGAGLILWDFDKFAADSKKSFLLFSPTEVFMPPISSLIKKLPRTMLLTAYVKPNPPEKHIDYYVQNGEAIRWMATNRNDRILKLIPEYKTGHKIVGQDITNEMLSRILQVKLGLANPSIIGKPTKTSKRTDSEKFVFE